MDNQFNRKEVIDILKSKGIKIPFGVTNDVLRDLYAKSLTNSHNKKLDLPNDKMVKPENIENKEKEDQEEIKPKLDDRFVVVKFLKNFTPYRKGDVATIEKARYEFIMKKDKSAITII